MFHQFCLKDNLISWDQRSNLFRASSTRNIQYCVAQWGFFDWIRKPFSYILLVENRPTKYFVVFAWFKVTFKCCQIDTFVFINRAGNWRFWGYYFHPWRRYRQVQHNRLTRELHKHQEHSNAEHLIIKLLLLEQSIIQYKSSLVPVRLRNFCWI